MNDDDDDAPGRLLLPTLRGQRFLKLSKLLRTRQWALQAQGGLASVPIHHLLP